MKKNATPIILTIVFASAFILTSCDVSRKTAKEDIYSERETSAESGAEKNLERKNDENQDRSTILRIEDEATPSAQKNPNGKSIMATIKTAKGDISLRLFDDIAPKTVENFVSKSTSGFYRGLVFHRVENWVIQGGDPLGNGTGGGDIPTELSDKKFKLGSLGVARSTDINVSNDSQFFICTADCSFLTGQYTNFGEVVEGMDVAKSIVAGDEIQDIVINYN